MGNPSTITRRRRGEWTVLMSSLYSYSHKTRRLPICVFYSMVNTAVVNVWVIFCCKSNRQVQGRRKRRTFMTDFALNFIKPLANKWLETPGMRNSVKHNIREVFYINFPDKPAVPRLQTQNCCFKCPIKRGRKTKTVCVNCIKPVCVEHSGVLCLDCL